MNSFLAWYRQRPLGTKSIIQTTVSVATFYTGILLEGKIQEWFEKDSPTVWIIRTAAIIGLLILLGSISLVMRTRLEAIEQRDYLRRRQLEYAWSLMDQYLAHQVAAVRTEPTGQEVQQRQQFIESVSTSPSMLSEIVRETYRFFESQHANIRGTLDSIVDFEVTFMTLSYRDKKLIIPAYANRQGRAPPSLELREKNPALYENTVAAKSYTEPRPTMKIIPDTMADPHYVDLYPGQKERIRSSLAFPILSDLNKVLGVLVVHCNQPKFFMESDRGFWTELLEIFGKRLALEKARLDRLVASDSGKFLNLTHPPPF
ncbi:GAF domain-containing protein [Hyalangium minutum]|uniref:GAF domain-containing protein n=1 Tax=Hyalangium minutum TaxID=394096 RepID=UPI0009FD2C89|nr:GAF domain-containing protein [Hyalangium minutum]